MYRHMYGSWGVGWFWMTSMIVLWLVVLGGVVYAAARVALKPQHKPPVGQ
jgi:hypothetical protein